MSFTGRSRDTLRSNLLGKWASEYSSIGYTLLTARGSDAYLWASATAVMLEGLEAQAEQVERDILPDQASSGALDRHAFVDGLTRRAGFTARHSVTVTSAIAGTYTINAGTRMAYSDGTLYIVEDASVVTSGGSPSGAISVRAVEPGVATTRTTGDTLTFSTAPTGLNSTGTVASTIRAGTDAESDSSLAERIIAHRRERPGSGNRADWREWVKGYTGTEITEAYVYPLLSPAGTPSTPGTVTVVAIGPAQGDSVTNTRIVPTDDASTRPGATELTRIEDYIEGDRLADGTSISSAPSDALRPVAITPGNYIVQEIAVSSQNVVMTVTVTRANAAQWPGTMTVVSATASTLVVSGNQTANANKTAIVDIGTANYRGGFKKFTLGAGVFGGVNTTFTMTDSAISTATGTVYPAVGNFDTIRTAVLAYFDALGPGDTSPASRWPTEDDGGRATLYRTALAAAAIDVSGVLSATVGTPAADVTPAAKTVVTLGSLRITS